MTPVRGLGVHEQVCSEMELSRLKLQTTIQPPPQRNRVLPAAVADN